MTRGKLITIEGLDGAGKSTLAEALTGTLTNRGIRAELLREPGGALLSERIRDLVKDPSLRIGARAEALLYAAARAELVQERVAPLLAAGTWVLLDRYVDSSLAYQGAGRGLGVEEVRMMNAFATGGLTPDRTLLLLLSPAARHSRMRERGAGADRLEGESDGFFSTVAAAYEQLAREEPRRIRTIDAERAPDGVLELALAAVGDLLPPSV